jgi:branched-chain amino acid transport system substrate-binding protein
MRKSIFARLGLMMAVLVLLGSLLAACGDTPTNTASAPATTAATATTAAAATTAATATTAASATTAAAATTAASGSATTAAAATTAASGSATTAAAAVQTIAPIANGNKTGVTDTEIVFGNHSPQSGGAAGYGSAARITDAYFKMINEQGGIYGRKLRLIIEDDAYQAARTTSVVKKLVEQDKVFAIVGGIGTSNNLAIRPYLNEQKVPTIAFSTGSSALVQMNPSDQTLNAKLHFGILTNYTFEGQVFANFTADNLKAKKVAVVYQNDGFGKEGHAAFVATAKSRNLEVVAEVTYETGASDLSTQAQRIATSGAEVIFLNAVPGPAAAFMKELQRANPNPKPKVLTTFVLNDPSFFSAAGTAAEGLYTSSFTPLPDSNDPKVVKFREFMAKYLPNEQVGSFALWGYIGAQILEEALKRAGKDLSREGLVAAMESITDWKGSAAANINFGANNRSPQNSLYMIQFSGGKFTQITEPLSK